MINFSEDGENGSGSVTVEVLVKICNALDCDVYDVLEIREHGGL